MIIMKDSRNRKKRQTEKPKEKPKKVEKYG